MSRIGKKAIVVPSGVNIEIDGLSVRVKGPKGLLERQFHPRMKIVKEVNEIKVVPQGETKLDKSLHGLTRTLIANMVHGVSDGFEKSLELVGVGYKAQKKGDALVMNLGFSHPVEIVPPSGISFDVEGQIIKVKGANKEQVGQVAADIRKIREPEPYKGTGIKYINEFVRRKQGKTTAK
ncbi:MAG TPA: 50S ribosomal protein L6 [Candidatus Atribacteria bacterium]|nr:50S ribosomal protein L6 [Candidatus Atribacteria bacterium]